MDYSIEKFWRTKFKSLDSQPQFKNMSGWDSAPAHVSSFVEAELSLREDFSDLSQPVWMIAAPGAVGKSTLAREICAATNAVYVDLALADTVAGHYIVGGLVNSNLYNSWGNETTTLLVDALDEARLRVTQSSFEDFLSDVARVASGRSLPIVLLGRVGIVEEAWLILNDRFGLSPPIFDIELFHPEKAKEFVLCALDRLAAIEERSGGRKLYPHLSGALQQHSAIYSEAVNFLVEHLTSATSVDGRNFSGYAPVLEAVATVIASESNPAKINDAITSILQGRILSKVTSEVMIRESGKLAAQLAASVPGVSAEGLYGPDEQLARLASLVFGVGNQFIPQHMPAEAVAAYESAVESLLPQHPFLDSKEPKPSGAVFAASILASALTSSDFAISRAAEQFAGHGPNTPNPFLLDFYEEIIGEDRIIPASHVGLLYASLDATACAGDVVRLSAEGDSSLDIEMSLVPSDGDVKNYEFTTIDGSNLRFGRRVSGVNIDAELNDIEIGDGGQVEFVAPVSIRARSILLSCKELVVRTDHATSVSLDPVVFLEVSDVIADAGLRPPIVRQHAKLRAAWPNAKIYPWTPFLSEGGEDSDPRMASAQRALRRLCISFRSHSKGRLARYKGKIEHFRMTKGALGVALRESLVRDNVLSLEGAMYFLDPDVLGQVVDLSFEDLKLKRYSPKSRDYLMAVLNGLDE